MAVASGPSGDNYVYLDRLDQFLEHSSSCPSILEKFDDTFKLIGMAKNLRENNYRLNFLFGCGSNQHNQLLLCSKDNAAGLVNNAEDAHEMKEVVLVCNDDGTRSQDPVCEIFAGGGHSGALTMSGRLYLFGWNDSRQLGTCSVVDDSSLAAPLPIVYELSGIDVEKAALGFSHTLVIEKGTRRLLAFGDNSRVQVDGTTRDASSKATDPTTPAGLEDERVVDIAAGLFHSAVISENGDLITFGCMRFNQSLPAGVHQDSSLGRWNPGDGAQLTRTACGRRHTVALDDRGRIWTFGDNKYGQLGRDLPANQQRDNRPELVELGQVDYTCFHVCCGWSHTVVLARDTSGSICAFGWGRNDKGQLGTGSTDDVLVPVRLFNITIQAISCGSESTVVLDTSDVIWSCGWNEHGNLATGNTNDCLQLTRIVGAPVTTTPGYPIDETRLAIAAGGAHLLAMKVVNRQ